MDSNFKRMDSKKKRSNLKWFGKVDIVHFLMNELKSKYGWYTKPSQNTSHHCC
jgi:hypothetical protein